MNEVGANGFDDGALGGGKIKPAEKGSYLSHGIGGAIPSDEGLRIFRAMANEDADVVQPGGSEDKTVTA